MYKSGSKASSQLHVFVNDMCPNEGELIFLLQWAWSRHGVGWPLGHPLLNETICFPSWRESQQTLVLISDCDDVYIADPVFLLSEANPTLAYLGESGPMGKVR